MRNQIAGVLLAAGEGSQLGGPKALVEVAGTPAGRPGVALLRDGGTAPVVVVTGAVDVPLLGVITVHNPDWRSGMGSSLAAGLGALPDACAAAVVALVDQPLIGPGVVQRLIAAYLDGAGIAVASYDGRLRNPVLLARDEWAGGAGAGHRRRRRPPLPPGPPGPGHGGGVRRHRPPRRRRHAPEDLARVSRVPVAASARRQRPVTPAPVSRPRPASRSPAARPA